MRSVIFVMFLLAVSINSTRLRSNLQKSLTKGECESKEVIVFASANLELLDVAANGESQNCDIAGGLGAFTSQKTVSFHLKDKQTVVISARGSKESPNSSGIIASVVSGEKGVWNTSNKWTCNGKPAIERENNEATFPDIKPEAKLIWADDDSEEVSCEITLDLCPATTTDVAVSISIDNQIKEVKVNDEVKDLNDKTGGNNDVWEHVKTFTFPGLKNGDKISFKGLNVGGPAGLVAEVRYKNLNGEDVKILSSSNTWKCNGKAPRNQEQKGTTAIWKDAKFKANSLISGDAWWIWSPDKELENVCVFTLNLGN